MATVAVVAAGAVYYRSTHADTARERLACVCRWARDLDVLMQLLVEAMVRSRSGGAIGIAVGVPLLAIMAVALTTTKWPMLAAHGFWYTAHESRTDWSMSLGSLLLLIVGRRSMVG